MTTSTSRRASSLDAELSAMYRPVDPPAHLANLIDGRIDAARRRYRARPVRWPHRTVLLAASVALLAVLAIAGGVVAQRLASGCGITIEDGVRFSDCVIGRPGLTNDGQPFAGTDILERTPIEAAEMAAEKGYTIRWQIEERQGTETLDDDQLTFSEDPPTCGKIAAGSVIEDGRIQMVVTINDPLTPGSEC
jgi:hypothetical protein